MSRNRVCWVRGGPGGPTGYGPGRRIDWDHIMSDVRQGYVIEGIVVPAFPIHLAIEVSDRDIEVLDVGAHNLPRSTVRVAEAVAPTGQPVLLDGVAR